MKKLICAVLASCLVLGLAGCGGKENPAPEQQAMGRYIETPVVETMENVSYIMDFHATEEGAVFYANYDDGTLKRATAQANGDVTEEEASWVKSLIDMGFSLVDLAETPDGVVYCIARNGAETQVFQANRNGAEVTAIPITDWPKTTSSTATIVDGETVIEGNTELTDAAPSGILAAQDGFVLIYKDQVEYRNSAGAKQKTFDGFQRLKKSDVSIFENTLLVKNSQVGEIQIFDLSSGESMGQHTMDEANRHAVAVAGNDLVYLVDPTGIYQQSSDGSIWERLLDGELTMLGMPSKSIDAAAFDNAGTFYAVLSDVSGFSIMSYFYSEDTPTQPDTELTIFSLNDSNIMRQAISEFQRLNPSVKVNLQIGLGNSGEDATTTQDVIRSLNTEILNGNGPDLIVLDGLPADSYIEKGILSDLSEFASQMEDGGLLENLLTGYQEGDKLYAIPAQFTIPIYISQNGSPEIYDLASLVEQTRTSATNTPPYLLAPSSLSDASGAFLLDWYDRTGLSLIQDGSFDAEKLGSFFAEIKSLYDSLLTYTEESDDSMVIAMGTGSSGLEVIDSAPDTLLNGEGTAYAMTLTGQSNLRNLSGLAEDGNWSITSLFEQGCYIPKVSVGILDSSEQKELALSFLSTLLGQKVQSVYLGEGFPVNEAALENTVNTSLCDESAVLYPMGQQFLDLCRNVDLAIVQDETVRNAVAEQAPFILDGTVTPDMAAQKINEAIKLYLTE